MKKIGELLEEQKQFVGRSEELALIKQQVTNKGNDWSILHFYGPSGMGKTTLLRYFQQLEHKHFPVLYIDGQEGFHHSSQFIQLLHDALMRQSHLANSEASTDLTEELNHLSQQYGAVLLLLDGLDRWSIQTWLREKWLSRLSTKVRVCSAGRKPLLDWHKAYGWGHVIHNRKLAPFSKAEWTAYASQCGIKDAKTLDLIGRLTEGIPLALSLICSQLIHAGVENAADKDIQRDLIYSLVRVLVQTEEMRDSNLKLLSLASIVYVFDQELLEHMLNEPISAHDFLMLCQSPCVKMHSNFGWSVKPGIRKWLRMDFKLRYPEQYERCKERAQQVLEQRIQSLSTADQRLIFELLIGKWFLHENEFLHSFVYYNEERKFSQRPARKEDLPKLEQMYQTNIQASPPYLPDDTRQEHFLQLIWNIKPEYIQIFEHQEKIAGFYCAVPYTRSTQNIFAKNEVLKQLFLQVPPEQESWFYWLAASDPPMDQSFMAYFLHHIFFPRLAGKRNICMACPSEMCEAMELTGFQRLPQAAYTSKGGLSFSFFQLDLRPANALDASNAEYHDKKLTPDEWVELAKQLLSHYSKLRLHTPLLQQFKQIVNLELPLPEIAEQLEHWLRKHFERLMNGNEREQMQAKILQYAYLQKIGTHETVADRLNLPMSTYYRYVRKLTESVANLLQMNVHV